MKASDAEDVVEERPQYIIRRIDPAEINPNSCADAIGLELECKADGSKSRTCCHDLDEGLRFLRSLECHVCRAREAPSFLGKAPIRKQGTHHKPAKGTRRIA